MYTEEMARYLTDLGDDLDAQFNERLRLTEYPTVKLKGKGLSIDLNSIAFTSSARRAPGAITASRSSPTPSPTTSTRCAPTKMASKSSSISRMSSRE
jgi:hypothetical protein